MSWVKPALSGGDDIFDEDGDELDLQSREWTSNMKKRVRDGYVDGVDAGEEASLQAGFNLGFREAAARTAAAGRLKGITSAIWCWCQVQCPESPVLSSVTELLQQVSQHEDQIIEDMRKALEKPAPSVSDVSESLEDLEVDQGDSGCEDADCCRRGENMDVEARHQPQRLCSGSSDLGESLNLLLQRCTDLVSELGLPQELIGHIQELKNLR